jgi:hypothetical protein
VISLTGTAGIGATSPPALVPANDRIPLVDQPLGNGETAAVGKDVTKQFII